MANYKEIKRTLKKFMSFIGPGILVSVAFMDPGNYSEAVSSAALYKYKLLFAIMVSNVFAVILQVLCCKLGIVTGKDLAENCKQHLPKKLNYVIYTFSQLAIIATDLAEIVGTAIALKILFNIPLLLGVLLTVLDCLMILVFYRTDGYSMKRVRFFELFVTSLVGLTVICFILELFKISIPNKKELYEGFLPHPSMFKDHQFIYFQIGIMGATIMPHSLFLGSSVVKSRLQAYDLKHNGKVTAKPTLAAIKSTLTFSYIELIISLFFIATFVNSAILIVSGATLYGQPNAEDADLLSIYDMLSEYLSPAAGLIFALSILFSGQSATFIGTMTSEIVSMGFLDWTLAPWLTKLITRLIAVVPCVFVTIAFGEKGISSILNLSQVVLSLILPIVAGPLIYFTSCNKYMAVEQEEETGAPDERTLLNSGKKMVYYTNGKFMKWSSIFIWFTISILNFYLVVSFMLGADVQF
ncbi:NRAMP-like transporter smf-3 [Hanseniaspora osmophila]|uniref:Iron transporter SMF3 n=1 Tax=Hanseniaspora osmophila TaxID=56408 RepID=A0A1E5R0D4_9ASCO|nr:Iron transporter SMF3 [Hanseniaspora osmophila]